MQVRVGAAGGRAIVALALAAVLGGCAKSANEHGAGNGNGKSSDASAAVKESPAAARGGTIGAAGSACEMPVRFDIAKDWKAKAIEGQDERSAASKGDDGDLSGALADAVLRQGPVTAVCEIDAKPAGNIGFLRVWTGRPGDADTGSVLRRFVAAEDNVSQPKYRSFKTGDGLSGVEVEYLYTSKLLEETKKESAFAVSTPDGPVVLHLGGLDTEEHEAMRPAYDLAKHSLKLA
ncbi:lipoprotein [Streptomyces sp. NPDC051452]|uniref:lipoprotein n=1 Tax=Streptomyces sp. NPDC051452 TaxID=3365654 RepID=UPI00379DA5AC